MNEYEVEVHGVKHTMLLDEEDAKRYAGAQLVQAAVEVVAEAAAQVVEPVEPVEPGAKAAGRKPAPKA
jgi:hypothetical protein